MPASQDPRSYVKPVPLPIPACKGLRLLARDTIHFNPEFPTREDVRKSNYKRRQFQMACTGFKAANHKPYIGIGDPFYLDQKKMILHALGQWSEDQASSSSSSEESDTEDHASDDVPKPAFTAAKFVLRRSRKDLNTLNKAVVHGRNMIRNVSLGHGLFDLIHKEKESKKLEKEEALRLQQEALRNEFQPPKAASDDETDEDLETDVDLTSYMVAVAPPAFLTQQQVDTDKELGIVNDNASDSDQSPEREPAFQTFTGMVLQAEEEEYQRARSAVVASQMTSMYSRPVSQRRKKQETPRPYTPQHTNISVNMSARTDLMSAENEHEFDITKDALFRQLCVLHWILEAMSTDPPSAMTPIMSCWSLTEIGGSRAQQRKLLKDKAVESSWEKFSKETTKKGQPTLLRVTINPVPQTLQVGKRLSAARGTRGAHGRRQLHVPGRGSAQSSANASQLGSSQEPKLASLLKPVLIAPDSASKMDPRSRGSATSPAPAGHVPASVAPTPDLTRGSSETPESGHESHYTESHPDPPQSAGFIYQHKPFLPHDLSNNAKDNDDDSNTIKNNRPMIIKTTEQKEHGQDRLFNVVKKLYEGRSSLVRGSLMASLGAGASVGKKGAKKYPL
ncbi:hypothetical protein DPMN_021397, partial [Dreissena polymorpha]